MKLISLFIFSTLTILAQPNADMSFLTDVGPLSSSQVITVSAKDKDSKVVKPLNHRKSDMLFMSNINIQYAFLALPKDGYNNISTIILPLMKDAFEAEGMPGVFEKINFYTLVKVEFLENDKNMPGNKVIGFEQNIVVSNTDDTREFIIDLDNTIALPEAGMFVQLTVIGRCDENGTVTKQDVQVYKNTDGTEKVWLDYCQPNFPLVESPKGTLTFVKNTNYSNNEWQAITRPALYSESYSYPDLNIGFGYSLVK